MRPDTARPCSIGNSYSMQPATWTRKQSEKQGTSSNRSRAVVFHWNTCETIYFLKREYLDMKMFPSYIWLAAYRGQGVTESVHQFQSTSLLSNKCDIYLIFFPQRKSNREPVVAVHSSAVFLIITSRFYWIADYWQALFDSRPPRMSLKPPVFPFPGLWPCSQSTSVDQNGSLMKGSCPGVWPVG